MQSSGWRRWALEIALGLVLPIGVARIDPLVERLPSLGVLRGRAAWVLVAVAALLALLRFLESRRPGWTHVRAPTWLLLVVAVDTLRRRRLATRRRAPGLGRRAALSRDGPEPLARSRPGPARRVRRGGVGRVRARPAPAALGRAAGRRAALSGPQPGPAPASRPRLRGPGEGGLCAGHGPGGRRGGARLPAPGAPAHGERGRLPGRVDSPRSGHRSSSTRSTSTRRRRRPSRRAGRWPCSSGRRAPREPRSPRFVPPRCRGCTSR